MDATAESALRLLEYHLGRSFGVSHATEDVHVKQSFAKLKYRPIRKILSVQAKVLDWQYSNVFGTHQVASISVDDVEVVETGIILPQSIWGGYSHATIEYEHGYDCLPDDIEQSVSILIEYIDSHHASKSILESPEIESLIKPYRIR